MTNLELQPACRRKGDRTPRPGRAQLASRNAQIARSMLAECRLCDHNCGADRLLGPSGLCHAGPHARIFSAQVEVGDESDLLPTFAVAFSGCDLRCDFCISGKSSWHARAGVDLQTGAIAMAATRAIGQGARSIMFLGGEPTVHLPDALAMAAALPDSAKLVWKTNAHGSAVARHLLRGIFDVWLADYKFGNDECAARLARAPRYTQSVRQNLCWAVGHSDLIVRHLLMPGHFECCFRPIAHWVADQIPAVKFSLHCGFWPAWRARAHPELAAPLSSGEIMRARDLAIHYGLNLVE